MKQAFTFGVLGVAILVLALTPGPLWVSMLLGWTGLSFLLAAAGYAWIGPRLFGKRDDGRLSGPLLLPALPFLLLSWGIWHLKRALVREAPCTEIAPGLWLGRRPFLHELPAGVGLVVDLTAEFPACRQVVAHTRYLLLPALDGSVPDPERFARAVRAIVECERGVYLHCAVGRGRSAMLAVAVLVARGLANDFVDAEEKIRAARPVISINAGQRAFLAGLPPLSV